MLANGLTQFACAEAVDDAHGLLSFEESAVEELVGFFEGIVNTLTNEIQFGGDRRNIGTRWGGGASPPLRRRGRRRPTEYAHALSNFFGNCLMIPSLSTSAIIRM